jgi:uncharacterized protein YvpB
MSSTTRSTSVSIPEGGFDENFKCWTLYNSNFSTFVGTYTFSIDSSTGKNLLINFDSIPSGQPIVTDSFFVQVWGF